MRVSRNLLSLRSSALVLLLVGIGCSSSRASTSASTSAPDSSTTVTLENVCDVMPPRYCAQDRPCCMKAGFGFDETACESSYRQACSDGVAAVALHHATFHPTNIDACVTAVQPAEDKCSLNAADFATVASKSTACRSVFEGTVAVGAACSSDVECAPATPPSSTSCVSGTCQSSTPAVEGQSCTSTLDCALGLVCDNTQRCSADPQPEYFVTQQGCAGADAGQ